MSALPPKADIPAPRGKNKSEMAGDREKRHIDLPHAPLAPALKTQKETPSVFAIFCSGLFPALACSPEHSSQFWSQ